MNKYEELSNKEIMDEMTVKELLHYASEFIKEANRRIGREE